MINFSLPKNNLNFKIEELNRKNKLNGSYRFNAECINIPWNSWGGDININKNSKLILNSDLIDLFANGATSYRVDLSSIYIDKTQFYNRYANLILEKGQNGSTILEISNLQLYDYIKQNYPNYFNFVLSPNAWLMTDVTPEMINVILEQEDFILVSLPHYLNNDWEYLNQIEKKNKIELTINSYCKDCKYFSECRKQEILNIYDFSNKSVYDNCNLIKTNNYLTLEELSQYASKGIQNFRFATPLKQTEKEYQVFLIQYFVKPEYQMDILKNLFLTF